LVIQPRLFDIKFWFTHGGLIMVLSEMQFISLLLKPDENLPCTVKANIPLKKILGPADVFAK
jgi:hypothetical protein